MARPGGGLAMCGLLMAQIVCAQAANAPAAVPPLDVITVRPNRGGGGDFRYSFDGIEATNASVLLMLTQAYHLFDFQIINDPPWAKTEGFDVKGKVTGTNAALVAKLTPDQKGVYFEQVLKERFGLVAHRETRELPEYALTVAKGGTRLEQSKLDPNEPPGPEPKSRWGSRMSKNGGRIKFVEADQKGLSFLLKILSGETDRTIIDKTGLTGEYDYKLTWSPQMSATPAGGDAPSDAAPDLFTAIQEQLGLKLEPMKGPVDVVVIDHIERPGEN